MNILTWNELIYCSLLIGLFMVMVYMLWQPLSCFFENDE